MKRLLVLLPLLIFIGCDTGSGPNLAIPSISRVLTGSNFEALGNGIETDSFVLGKTVYFCFDIHDSDLDIKDAVISQKSENNIIPDIILPLEHQSKSDMTYGGYTTAAYDGDWEISIYVLDAKGNKSNSVTKKVTITTDGVTISTVKYDINGGTGKVPIDNRKYTGGLTTILKNTDEFYKSNYHFLYWSSKPDGYGSKFLPGEGIGLGKPGESIFYAVWSNPLTNVHHSRNLSGNSYDYTIYWDEPGDIQFKHVLIDIFTDSPYSNPAEFLSNIIVSKGISNYSFNYNRYAPDNYIYIRLTLIDNNDYPTKKIEYRIDNVTNNFINID
jgi:hypothetical protein